MLLVRFILKHKITCFLWLFRPAMNYFANTQYWFVSQFINTERFDVNLKHWSICNLPLKKLLFRSCYVVMTAFSYRNYRISREKYYTIQMTTTVRPRPGTKKWALIPDPKIRFERFPKAICRYLLYGSQFWQI